MTDQFIGERANGRLWTSFEIDELCRVAMQGGDVAALSERFHRTPKAVIAKAGRLALHLRPDSPSPNQLRSVEKDQGSLLP